MTRSRSVAPFVWPRWPWQDVQYTSGHARRALRLPQSPLAWVVTAYAFSMLFITLFFATHGVALVGSRVRAYDLRASEYAALVVLVVFFAYVEGWQGFHKSWSPYVVRRSLMAGLGLSAAQPVRSLACALLAPLFAAGLFYAAPRRLMVAYTLYPMIVVFVMIVVRLPHPLHEIVDIAVAVGIGLGTLSLPWHLFVALRQGIVPADSMERHLIDERDCAEDCSDSELDEILSLPDDDDIADALFMAAPDAAGSNSNYGSAAAEP